MMEKQHAMLLFSDMYPEETISRELTSNINAEQITNPAFNNILYQFLNPENTSNEILKCLLKGKPLVFMMAYFLAFQLSRKHRKLNKSFQQKCNEIMFSVAKEEVVSLSDKDLSAMLSKNLYIDKLVIERKDNTLLIPLECCISNMVNYVQGFNNFKVIVGNEYILYQLAYWITDSQLELNKISEIVIKANPSFIERGLEFETTIESFEQSIRTKEYNKLSYIDKLTLTRFKLLYNILDDKKMVKRELTVSAIRDLLEKYKPENEHEKAIISYLLQEYASTRTNESLQKKHSDIKNNIHDLLSSPLIKNKVRIRKSGTWLKYTLYPIKPKINLETFEDIGQLVQFPCMKKIFEMKGGPHNVLVAMFSTLLWFYTIEDCHYIIKDIIGLEKYSYNLTNEQLRSLIDENETPKYLYGHSGFVPYCIGYNQCPRCWISSLSFPEQYYIKKDNRQCLEIRE